MNPIDDRAARNIARAQKVIRELRDGYVELHGMTSPERGAAKVGGSASVHAPAPVALDVVDLTTHIDQLVTKHLRLVRGSLRMGNAPRGVQDGKLLTTARALGFIAESLPWVWADNPDYGVEVARDMWQAWGRVQRGLGRPNQKPHRVHEPCPKCGEWSLWVAPSRLCVACGMPGCGFQRALGENDGGDAPPNG